MTGGGPTTGRGPSRPAARSPVGDLLTRALHPGPAGRRRARLAVRAGFGLFVLATLVVGWLAVRGLLAARHLAVARTEITALQREVLAGRAPTGRALTDQLAAIRRETGAAKRLTGDPVWAAAALVPAAGCPARTARALARDADRLATRALPPLAGAADALVPAKLRHGATVELAPLTAARAPLARAGAALAALLPGLRRVDGCGAFGRLTGLAPARDELADRVGALATTTRDAGDAATLLPAMLGAAGTRRYLLVVQNDAESRATGGIIGAYGLLTADRGRLDLADVRGNNSLPGKHGRPVATDLGRDFDARYGPFQSNSVWGNSNLSPDYPTVAEIWSGLYRRGTGITVDGTITLDPTALSYLLAVAGPAHVPHGPEVTAAHLVPLVESTVYATIANGTARDAFFAAVGKASYQAAIGARNSVGLVRALGRAAGEGRLAVSSRFPAEEALLRTTPLGGALPAARGPYLAVVTQNPAASKLDYWLRRDVAYDLVRGPGGTGLATVTLRLTNAAPAGLPAYVRQRKDLPDPANPAAQSRVWLSVYAGIGAGFTGATVDGAAAELTVGTERGHPVFSTYVTLPAGRTRTVVVHLREPTVGPLVVRPQPAAVPDHLTVRGVPLDAP